MELTRLQTVSVDSRNNVAGLAIGPLAGASRLNTVRVSGSLWLPELSIDLAVGEDESMPSGLPIASPIGVNALLGICPESGLAASNCIWNETSSILPVSSSESHKGIQFERFFRS